MIKYGLLFAAWILILYLVPFAYVRLLNRVDIDLMGYILLMIPTSLIFPLLFLTINNDVFFPPFIIYAPIMVLFLWFFFTDDLDMEDNFLLSIINIYLPAIAAMLILLFLGVFEFSLILILPFIVPIVAYYFFKQLGYISSCTFFINYLIFDLEGALIMSALSAAGIILYKFRFRQVEDLGDISIEETIHTGMPVFAYTGFSKVKNYSEIPDEAIDPYTLENIHDLIMKGKEIVKCNACGTYYDKEILKFYGNSCAVLGCSNSQL